MCSLKLAIYITLFPLVLNEMKKEHQGAFLPIKGTKNSLKGTLKKADTGKSLMLELLTQL